MSAAEYLLKAVYNLAGTVALVSGGGTGIGIMIAKALAANGSKVYITGRRKEVLEKVASEWDGEGKLIPIQMDVTKKQSILAAKKVVQEADGKLHILVNNAGQVGPVSPFMTDNSRPENQDAETIGNSLFQEGIEEWAKVYEINTFSAFFVTTAFLGMLAKGAQDRPEGTSTVVNITSMSASIKVAQDHFAYNSSKAATSHLTRMMATEFALKNIPVRVNAIAPGPYASEMTPQGAPVDKIAKGIVPIPAKRQGNATEMAGTIIYLASPAGGYINGQEIVVDGGFMAVNPSTT